MLLIHKNVLIEFISIIIDTIDIVVIDFAISNDDNEMIAEVLAIIAMHFAILVDHKEVIAEALAVIAIYFADIADYKEVIAKALAVILDRIEVVFIPLRGFIPPRGLPRIQDTLFRSILCKLASRLLIYSFSIGFLKISSNFLNLI